MVAPSPLLARSADLSNAKRALLDKLLANASAAAVAPEIPRRPSGASVPLSFSQQSLWFFHQLDPQSPLYHLPIALRLAGPLNLTALQQSLNTIVARHEILRTCYVVVDETPTQHVEPASEVPFSAIDLSTQAVEGRELAVRALIDQECRRPFDLTHEPLLRALLVRTTETEHTLVLSTHHIAADGWSWGIFFRELAELYGAATAGRARRLRRVDL
ncbi:MAG: condensation domain-containing protein [Opitutaceae bacterium]|nr:condensation domain-containing protein [Opitutaceae bacterium]